MSITDNLLKIRATLPQGVTLVAVSKFHPLEALREAYAAGQRVFGESREQELKVKHEAMPADVEWHFIGHLQTNKVKAIIPYVHCIQSVDTAHLLDEVERQAARLEAERQAAGHPRTVDVLLQVHIAREETKSGFTPEELRTLLATTDPAARWPHVRLRGLMGMATNTDDAAQVRREFAALAALKVEAGKLLASKCAAEDAAACAAAFDTLSMGMSEDYPLAIEAGSTMVRIGTDIFGAREY
jgi:pyridoxal phosphate enzyme (YggS family)